MDEQEHIEEMVSILAASNNPFVDVPIEIMPKVAEALYNADYRKADEVRKETVREFAESILRELWNIGIDGDGKQFKYGDLTSKDVWRIAEQFGVKAEDCDK